MNINKYWIGFLYGVMICLNVFSAGVILGNILSLNWIFFFHCYYISLIVYIVIKILKNKQINREKNDKTSK